MHKVVYALALASLGLAVMLTLPHTAWSFSASSRPAIGDGEPWCPGCHAAVRESHHPELQAEASKNEVYTTKLYKALEKQVWGLRPVDPEQRKQLLEAVAAHADVDGNRMPFNGMPFNGMPIQGMPTNALPMNGTPLNGLPTKEGSPPTVQSESLPWSTLSQRPLGTTMP